MTVQVGGDVHYLFSMFYSMISYMFLSYFLQFYIPRTYSTGAVPILGREPRNPTRLGSSLEPIPTLQ
jgi:hypothetical protein